MWHVGLWRSDFVLRYHWALADFYGRLELLVVYTFGPKPQERGNPTDSNLPLGRGARYNVVRACPSLTLDLTFRLFGFTLLKF